MCHVVATHSNQVKWPLLSKYLYANPMSFNSSSVGSAGSTTPRGTFEFGRTYVVKPKGNHLATVVWLHGLGDKGLRNVKCELHPELVNVNFIDDEEPNKKMFSLFSWSQLLETLPLPNIKWICPTAPTRPVAMFGGFPCTAWFDVGEISEDAPDDLEGLDAAATFVANLLSAEPAHVKLGIGGFSVGAATALYSATCQILGQYGNGNPYPINVTTIVGLSGWLPRSRSLTNRIVGCQGAADRAASLPILLCHGLGDDVVSHRHGEKSAQALRAAGFHNLRFRSYNGGGHHTTPEEMDEVCHWLTAILRLEHGSA